MVIINWIAKDNGLASYNKAFWVILGFFFASSR
jgi:hypothetical protein